MENTNEKYSKNGILNPDNIPAAQNDSVKTPGNQSFEHSSHDPNSHLGSTELSESYPINDKAHHDSSKNDFIKTVSNFHHANPHENTGKNAASDDNTNSL